MKILLYFQKSSEPAKRLLRLIESYPEFPNVEILHSISKLSDTLKQLNLITDDIAVVLFVTTTRLLSELAVIGDELNKVRVILVLPDAEEETIHAAHRLMPRYIGYGDSDLTDVVAVLKKMSHHLSSQQVQFAQRMNENKKKPPSAKS